MNNTTMTRMLLGCAFLCASVPAFADTTSIATCPFVIAESGVYHVTQDLTCPGEGIAITANDVELHLDGHTLDGGSGLQNGQTGIDVSGSNDRVFGSGLVTNFGAGIRIGFSTGTTVINCTLKNNGAVGIGVAFSSDTTLISNSALGNKGYGIRAKLSNNIVLKANQSDGSEGAGIELDAVNGSIIQANQTDGNQYGIRLSVNSTGNIIKANAAHGNTVFDLDDDNSGCDANTWKGNSFATANQPCIQ
jgi:parallel beta-helix repeat protein